MFRIAKRFTFAAAHSLPSLPENHKCHRLHGHNYVVEVELERDGLDEHGMVWDYAELGIFKNWLEVTLDHRNLNDLMMGATTAENLARHLYNIARDLHPSIAALMSAVRVQETENTWAEYRPR